MSLDPIIVDSAILILRRFTDSREISIESMLKKVRREYRLKTMGVHYFPAFFKAFEKLSPKEVQNFALAFKGRACRDGLIEDFEVSSFYGEAKGESAKGRMRATALRILNFIDLAFGDIDIKTIQPDKFREILDCVKNPLFSYFDFIKEDTAIGFRSLARLLKFYSGNNDFVLYAKVSRTPSVNKGNNEFSEWIKLAEQWMDSLTLKSTKQQWRSIREFLEVLKELDCSASDPIEFMKGSEKFLLKTIIPVRFPKRSNIMLRHISDFTDWILENFLSTIESGIVKVPDLNLLTHIEYSRLIDSISTSQKRNKTDKLLLPIRYTDLLISILEDDNFAWPKSIESDYFIYFHKNGLREKVWVPVNAYLFLTMLRIPVRKIQVAMLDSGEGDSERYLFSSHEWVKNLGPHANYWARLKAKRPSRGAITRIYDEKEIIAGIYINTNKTQDRNVGFGADAGYTIKWQNLDLIKLFHDLRLWQERYNPVSYPTKYSDLPRGVVSDYRPSASVVASIPDRFYLFRSPSFQDGNFPFSPPTNNVLMRFWFELMGELERRLKLEGDDTQITTRINEVTGQIERTIFTPHGLRGSGLTSLAEAGVPISVLSNVVAGHTTYLMTLYYIKHRPAYITSMLNAATKAAQENSKADYMRFLEHSAFDEAKTRVVANCPEALIPLKNLDNYVRTGCNLGICPFGGTRCNDGGQLLRSGGKSGSDVYGPVPGGSGNCVRCRHFLTGLPWLMDLWLHGNSLLARVNFLSTDLRRIKVERDALTIRRKELSQQGESKEVLKALSVEIDGIYESLRKKTVELDETLMDVHATHNLIESIQKLEKVDSQCSEDRFALVANASIENIDYLKTTNFALQDLLVQASRIYPHLRNREIEYERNHFVDQILINNGLKPISFTPVSTESKNSCLDAISEYLLRRVGAQECDNLYECKVTLGDLGLDSTVSKITQHLGSPIDLTTLIGSNIGKLKHDK